MLNVFSIIRKFIVTQVLTKWKKIILVEINYLQILIHFKKKYHCFYDLRKLCIFAFMVVRYKQQKIFFKAVYYAKSDIMNVYSVIFDYWFCNTILECYLYSTEFRFFFRMTNFYISQYELEHITKLVIHQNKSEF